MANTIKLKRASGSDPGASDLSVGELAIRTSNCKLFSKNDGGSAVGVVAGSADTLTTARTIAGVSFDGSGNISLNNNAITNGAGYIADVVSDTSPQLGGDLDVQSSKITTATSNGNVKIEPNGTGVVEVRGAGGNDGKLQLNCSAQSHGIVLASPAHSAGQSYTIIFPDNNVTADKYLKVKSISGSGSTAIGQLEYASLDANDLGEGTIPDARFPSTLPSGVSVASANIVDGTIVNGDINASAAIAGSKLANPISLPDDHKISFGTGSGNNLEIFHESTSNTNEIIAVDGDIHVQCDNFMLISDSTAGRAIYLDESNSRLELGFDGGHDAYFTGSGVEFIQDVKFDGATAGRDITFDRSDNALEFADNAKATFGADADFEIYHDSSHSWIKNSTGNLYINPKGAEVGIALVPDGKVELRYDDAAKLETSSAGVTVTGTCTATTFSGSGASLTSLPAGNLTGTLPAIDGSNLTGISAGATGGGSDEIFYENGQNVTTDYTITNGKNAMSAGPITIDSGVTVTVGAGETLTIV